MATAPSAPNNIEVETLTNPNATGLINAPSTSPATNQTPATVTPSLGTASTQDPAVKWEVSPNQTVAGQVKDIIADNSPLMQQAETRALQKANSRGLLNSSLAVGAGQSALYDAATPMATQDAAMHGKAAESNATSQNAVNSQNSQLETNVSLNNAATKNAADQFNASQTNDILKLNMDAASKTNLANIEASYKTLMQSSASASDLYKQMVLNASNIMSSTTMDAAAKQQAIKNQIALLNSGLGVIGQISNLDLEDLLTFEMSGADGATATPAPTPPPVGGLTSAFQNIDN
jgi:hypothetical protein